MSIDLFQRINSGINYPELIFLLNKSIKESFIKTVILAFYIRDVKGLGKRKIGRSIFQFLLINYPEKFQKLIPLIPIYGRWDDLLYLFPNSTKLEDISYTRANYCSDISAKVYKEAVNCQQYVVEFFCNTMNRDLYNMLENKGITLLGKWAPTEYSSKDYKHRLVKTICNYCKISPRIYRKKYITPLRKKLKIVERYMCKKEWEKIDYNLVPNNAKNKFYNAFVRNGGKKFLKRSKKNTQLNCPYSIVANYSYTLKLKPDIEKHWINHLKLYDNNYEDLRVCIDTSSQMYSRKNKNTFIFNKFFLDTAISTALVLSNKTNIFSNFNEIITFNKDDSLIDKILKINKLDIPNTDNLYSIISKFVDYTTIIITAQKLDLNFYNKQKIIYWLISDDPINITIENNLTTIHGYNNTIVKTILKYGDINCEKIMNNITEDSRYNLVKNKL